MSSFISKQSGEETEVTELQHRQSVSTSGRRGRAQGKVSFLLCVGECKRYHGHEIEMEREMRYFPLYFGSSLWILEHSRALRASGLGKGEVNSVFQVFVSPAQKQAGRPLVRVDMQRLAVTAVRSVLLGWLLGCMSLDKLILK